MVKNFLSDSQSKLPKQDRAKRTYESILMAAQEILAQSGIEAVNSNSIVERAGVTAPAFYRYFSNKYELLLVLTQRLTEAQNNLYQDLTTQIDNDFDTDNLYDIVLEILQKTHKINKEFIGGREILISLRAIPELSQYRLDSNSAITKIAAKRLSKVLPNISYPELLTRTRLGVEIGYSILELLLDEQKMDANMALEATAKAIVTVQMPEFSKPQNKN